MTARRSLRAARLEVARLRAAVAEAARRAQYQALLLRAVRRSYALLIQTQAQTHATE